MVYDYERTLAYKVNLFVSVHIHKLGITRKSNIIRPFKGSFL